MSTLQWFATHPNTKSTSWAVLGQPLTPVPLSLWPPQWTAEVLLTTREEGARCYGGGAATYCTSSGRLTTRSFSVCPTKACKKYSLQAASTARWARNSFPSTISVTSQRMSCFRWSFKQRRILVQCTVDSYTYMGESVFSSTDMLFTPCRGQGRRKHKQGGEEQHGPWVTVVWWDSAQYRDNSRPWPSSPLMLKSKKVPRERYHDWYWFDATRFHPVMLGLATCPTNFPPQNQNRV